jgi:hypothetical protein
MKGIFHRSRHREAHSAVAIQKSNVGKKAGLHRFARNDSKTALSGITTTLLATFTIGSITWAATPVEVEYTVQQILAHEGVLFVDYSIGESGKIIVLFGINEPDWRIEKAVKALQSHPDIKDLTWVKTDTDFCPIR